MSAFPKPVIRNVVKEPLWREANDVANYMYEKGRDFPESETWYAASKLHAATLDMLFYVSEALGGTLPSTIAADWSNARRAVAAIRTIYPFSAKQGFIELEPEIVVRLDKLLQLIDQEVQKTDVWMTQAMDTDLAQWREKYKIWKKIDDN